MENKQWTIGDSVVVKPGVTDPDMDGDISGWQGRIIAINEDQDPVTVGIKWDSLTLKSIPSEQIVKCEEEGLSWSEMNLYASEVVPAFACDTPADVAATIQEFELLHNWQHPRGEQGKGVQETTITIRHASNPLDSFVLGQGQDCQAESPTFDACLSSYPPPVNQLLTYGDIGSRLPDTWPNYLELGLGLEHIPDLIRMVADKQLNEADIDDVAGWAPMHAYRALGQLQTERAIEPLLSLFNLFRKINDFAMEELPYVFAMIGPVALPETAEYIANSSHNEWARICAIECVEKIGLAWSEAHSECVAILIAQLEFFEENDYEVNTFLIEALVELQAMEAAPLIERAFVADRVEEFIIGNWDDIQVRLGMKSAEEVEEKRTREREERRHRQEMAFPSIKDDGMGYARTSPQISYKTSYKSEAGIRKKTKNKMAKQSRKKNRKR